MENPPTQVSAHAEPSPVLGHPSSPRRVAVAMLLGGLGFSVASILAYSIWATGLIEHELALYSSIALAYLLLSGLFIHRLVPGERKFLRFYAAFVPAFLCFAMIWTVCYFSLRGTLGETVGSALGLAVLTPIMLAVLQRRFCWFWECLGILFLFHTLGYTLGGLCYYSSYGVGAEGVLNHPGGNPLLASFLDGKHVLAILLWGFFHGLGFGAGLGYLFTRPKRSSPDGA